MEVAKSWLRGESQDGEERVKKARRAERARRKVIRPARGSPSGRLLAAGDEAKAEVLWSSKTGSVSIYLWVQ